MIFKPVWRALLFLVVLLTPTFVSAHLPGQPPFTYVNGEAAGYYPINFSSLPDLVLPQDTAPRQYLVNTELNLKMDSAAMPFFPEELPFYEFSWDLGDETPIKKGLEVTPTYTTTGSKIIIISSRDTRTKEAAQMLSTVYLNVVPTLDYTLPQPTLSVNGIQAANTLSDSIPVAFTKKVMLDASKSSAGSAPIASYTWDLGNRQLAKDAKVTVTYDNLFSSIVSVVRVTDKNGLFVDASVQLENITLPGPDGKIPDISGGATQSPWERWGLAIIVALLLGTVATAATLWRRRTRA